MTRIVPDLVRSGAAIAALVALWVGAAAPAQASGFLVSVDRQHNRQRHWSIESYKVDVVVRGPHARVRVEQVFKNLGRSNLEADYIFPLPRGAMVSSITLFESGKGLEGRLLRAEEARRIFEEIMRRRKDPALLQYVGQNIYRVRVFPIPPGQTRKLVLTYDQTLTTDAGLTELSHPLSSVRFSAAPIRLMTMHVDLQTKLALGPIYSPTHDVAVTRAAKNRAEISYEGPVPADAADLLLYWTRTSRRIGATLLTYWPEEESQGYFLFLATPSLRDGAGSAPRPKNVTFVVDVSGSMGGEKLEQVRAALKQIIPSLNEADQFNVIAYHNRVFALWQKPHVATRKARDEALLFVDALSASGGTRIEGALLTALSAPTPEHMPSVIVFLTDGVPTMGETDPDKILAMARRHNQRAKQRIFVLGVGVDVNTVMLDRLALENHGSPAFVRPRENVEVKVSSLYDKVRHPVLTEVKFTARGMKADDCLPHELPGLFRGSELVLAGRYGQGGPVELVLSGRDGALEREFHYTLAAGRRGQGLASDFPARVWATRRIAELLDAIRLHKRKDRELVDEIVRLSTKFGILTEYTAFLADETGVSHRELALNSRRAQRNIDVLMPRIVGGSGVAQSLNNLGRRGATRVDPASVGFYVATASDRDLQRVARSGVQNVANRTFYYRGRSIGWVDAKVRSEEKPAQVLTRWSPEFFRLLHTTSGLENVRLSQAGPLLLEIRGQVVRIEDPK